jgi:hypothetical protein
MVTNSTSTTSNNYRSSTSSSSSSSSSNPPTKRFSDVLWKRCTATSVEAVSSSSSFSSPPLSSYHNKAVPTQQHDMDPPDQPLSQLHQAVLLEYPTTATAVPLDSFLILPLNFHEWCIPSTYQQICHPDHIQPPPINSKQTTSEYPKPIDPTCDWNNAHHSHLSNENDDYYYYIPVVAMRRQSISHEQRYYEDAANRLVTPDRFDLNLFFRG